MNSNTAIVFNLFSKNFLPVISVVIPHANSLTSVTTLLKSLEGQKCEESFEVIVVSNPEGKYAQDPDLKFSFPLKWDQSVAGANAARFKGLRSAQGEIIVFLDDDCEISDSCFLQKHLEKHREPQVMGLGGRYRLKRPTTLFGRIYNKLQNQWLNNHRLPQGFNTHLLGGNSSFKRQVFAEENFDQKLIFGGTETEFQIRLFHRGFKLKLHEDLSLEHHGDLKFLDFICKSFKQGMGSAYITQRHARPPKFIFAHDASRAPWWERVIERLYKISFDSGKEYFLATGEFKVPRSEIYKRVLKASPKVFFRKDLPLWYELAGMGRVIKSNLLSSKHSNGSASAKSFHKDESQI